MSGVRGESAEVNLWDQARKIPHGIEVIAEWLGSGGHVVDKDEAQRRADICLKCPLNQSTPILTAAVAAAVKKHLEVKNGLGLRVNGEKQLGMCEVCGCALRLKIHCPDDKVLSESTPDEQSQYPDYCWQKEPTP